MSNDQITDDFLNGIDSSPDDLFPLKEVVLSTANTTDTNTITDTEKISVPIKNEMESTDTPPDLVGTDYPEDYIKIVNRVKYQYSILPNLNYNKIYEEISDLTVQSNPTPTLEVLSDELFRVQAAKDRLSDILVDVIKCYNFKKRIVDILKDSWGKFTSEKNTEGRKADASFRLSNFLIDFSRTEALCKTCDHILKNLDGLQDNLSRRITIWQLLLKVREGRMSLPDYDFDKEAKATSSDLFANNNNGIDGSDSEKSQDHACPLREF
jgi:hypothetical protein